MPTVDELRKMAKNRGLTGYSKLKKANLMNLLGRKASPPKVKSPTVDELRRIAKNRGLTGYSKLKKANLKNLLKSPKSFVSLSPVPTPVGSPNNAYVSPLGLSGISPTPSALAEARNLLVSNENIVKYMKKHREKTTIKKVAEHFGVARKRVRNLYEVTYVTPSPPPKRKSPSPPKRKSPKPKGGAKSPTLKNLREKAKRFGFTGYSKMKKENIKRLFRAPPREKMGGLKPLARVEIENMNTGEVYVYDPAKNRYKPFANIIARSPLKKNTRNNLFDNYIRNRNRTRLRYEELSNIFGNDPNYFRRKLGFVPLKRTNKGKGKMPNAAY